MTHPGAFPSRTRQTGIATLVVAMVLLIAATFITFFSAKVGVQEQRMSANDYRYKQGFSTGEAGLERAKVFLASDRSNFGTWPWQLLSALDCDPPTSALCTLDTTRWTPSLWRWVDVSDLDADTVDGLDWDDGDGPFLLFEGDPTVAGASFSPVVLAARGRSDDDTGLAFLRVNQTRFLVAQPGPVPPIMAPTVPLGGNFTVVGNPNHNLDPMEVTLANCDDLTGSGQMLSIWSEGAVPVGGTWKTCAAGSFRDGNSAIANRCIGVGIPDPSTLSGPSSNSDWSSCNCRNNPAEKSPYSGGSAGSGVGINDDVVDSDPNFPGDIFLYVFGRTKDAIKASAASDGNIFPNCDSLNQNSTGLFWITGNCNMPANSTVGSRTSPAIVVFEGNASFQSNSHFWGMVIGADMQRSCPGATPADPYSVDSPCTSTDSTPNVVDIQGTFTIHGAMVVEGTISGSGDYKAVYDPCVFAAMGAGTGFDKFGPVAGSWNDRL